MERDEAADVLELKPGTRVPALFLSLPGAAQAPSLDLREGGIAKVHGMCND